MLLLSTKDSGLPHCEVNRTKNSLDTHPHVLSLLMESQPALLRSAAGLQETIICSALDQTEGEWRSAKIDQHDLPAANKLEQPRRPSAALLASRVGWHEEETWMFMGEA